MPAFAPGEAKTARVTLQNPTTKDFSYQAVLTLGLPEMARAEASLSIPAAGEKQVSFPVTLPNMMGTFPVYISVSAGNSLIGVYRATEDVSIAAATAALSGAVTDTAGNPLGQVGVTLNGQTTQSRSDGMYGFGLIPPGTYQISFVRGGYQTVTRTITLISGHNDLNVQLPAGSQSFTFYVNLKNPLGNQHYVILDLDEDLNTWSFDDSPPAYAATPFSITVDLYYQGNLLKRAISAYGTAQTLSRLAADQYEARHLWAGFSEADSVVITWSDVGRQTLPLTIIVDGQAVVWGDFWHPTSGEYLSGAGSKTYSIGRNPFTSWTVSFKADVAATGLTYLLGSWSGAMSQQAIVPVTIDPRATGGEVLYNWWLNIGYGDGGGGNYRVWPDDGQVLTWDAQTLELT